MPFTGKPQYPSRPGTCPAWLRIDMNHIVSRAPTVKLGTDCTREESGVKAKATKDRHQKRKAAGRIGGHGGREKTSLEIYSEMKDVPLSVIKVIAKACVERTGDNQFRFFRDELDKVFDELYPGPDIYTANYISQSIYSQWNGRFISRLVEGGYLKPKVVLNGVSLYSTAEVLSASQARANDPKFSKRLQSVKDITRKSP